MRAVERLALSLLVPLGLVADVTTPRHILAGGFEHHYGPGDQQTRFLGHTAEHVVAIDPDGTVILRPLGGGREIPLEWVNNNVRHSQLPEARNPLPSQKNYYRGADPANWQVGVPLFETVAFRNFYPGIELSYHLSDDGLEYEFQVSPGSHPGVIALRVPAGWRASIEDSGSLHLVKEGEVFRHRKPIAFQVIDGKRVSLAAEFQLAGDIIRLRLPDGYDPNWPLVIDPVVTFSSNLGGAGWDAAYAVTSDISGNIYVTGDTASTDFPATNLTAHPIVQKNLQRHRVIAG